MAGALLTSTCSDGIQDVEEDAPQPAAVISNPIVGGAGAPTGTARSAVFQAAGDEVVYVSLAPDSFPTGEVAILRNPRQEASVTASMRNGGLDAVPVAASAGDTVLISIRGRSGEAAGLLALAVPDARKPRVVRVSPTRKKRDVPLNLRPLIFFTEPVTGASVTPASVQLLRGGNSVAGTVRLLEGTGATAAFVPDAALDANTEYRLVVTQAVEDLAGESLEASYAASFTTGQSLTGPPAVIRLSPDTVVMTGATYQMTATVEDAAGNILIDQPITWSTSDPEGLAVSSTGLLTALAEGGYTVVTRLGELATTAFVFVTSPDPPASITLSPGTATVAAEDSIVLTATVRDASQRRLDREVTWSTSDPAKATVVSFGPAGAGHDSAAVIGANPGSVTITATSGTASGMAAVTVGPRRAVASLTLAPASAALVVRGTVRLMATLEDASGRAIFGRPVVWTTDDAAVATVDAGGVVTAIATGSTAVVASSEGVSDTAAITVAAGISFASVSAGSGHTCGLTEGGSAYCWGHNYRGQLGDGSFSPAGTHSPAPLAVIGGLSFATLTAGSDDALVGHSCGVTATGAAYCWGENQFGELGDGSTADRTAPAAVAGGLTVSTVSAGADHTCGLTPAGQAYCWGRNDGGQLGDGSTTPSAVPVAVAGGRTFSAVSAGSIHTCALTTAGAAYCWGVNVSGQLGNGTTNYSPVPDSVRSSLTFSALASGWEHTCAIATTGAAHCWGEGRFGQLGDGWSGDFRFIHISSIPVAVSGGRTFSAVSTGSSHTCGVTTPGDAYCWGNNVSGSLGDGSTANSSVPVAVAGGLTFSAVTAGVGQSCGRTTSGEVYCWGLNNVGQLGVGASTGPETCRSGAGDIPCSTVPARVAGQP
ncbi:MAG: Ig-like domain-containing protein [Gemmatimonadetes bacterium]|nr:Ig-like domain-containing protein [Gemmatimonadota bacterium]